MTPKEISRLVHEKMIQDRTPITPGYAYDLVDMWIVVDKVCEAERASFNLFRTKDGGFEATFENESYEVVGVALTAPLAVCYAALEWMGVQCPSQEAHDEAK